MVNFADRAERHYFWPRLLLFFYSPFLFLPKEREEEKENEEAKILTKSHAFLLDQLCHLAYLHQINWKRSYSRNSNSLVEILVLSKIVYSNVPAKFDWKLLEDQEVWWCKIPSFYWSLDYLYIDLVYSKISFTCILRSISFTGGVATPDLRISFIWISSLLRNTRD